MEGKQPCVRDNVNVCQLCGVLENLSVCGGCKGAWYCSKPHQKLDWKKHKLICKRAVNSVSSNNDTEKTATEATTTTGFELDLDRETNTAETMTPNKGITENCGHTTESNILLSSKVGKSTSAESGNAFSLTHNNLSNSSNNEGVIHAGHEQQFNLLTKIPQPKTYKKKQKNHIPDTSYGVQQQRYYLDQTTQVFDVPPSFSALSRNRPSDPSPSGSVPSLGTREQYLFILQARFNEVSKYVVKCLTQYGICVVDKFLGEATCQKVFDEAIDLKSSGVMNQGQLVNGPSSSSKNKHIRGDIITWLDGGESSCQNIHYLISCMDTVMLQASKSLDKCNINERTKGMVACYPGKGSGYIRHIDNPNGDGRCVTSLYYLNKDWDVRKDGGLLRIYPEGSDQVANIEPVADRLLFFWSDRRNPHEVEKALRERYAITVWYYDADERAQALKRLKDGASS